MFDTLETQMLLWVVLLTTTGSVVNYVYHKWSTKALGTMRTRSLAVKAMFGAVAGLVLTALTNGGEGLTEWTAVLMALPVGAVAESYVAKFLNRTK